MYSQNPQQNKDARSQLPDSGPAEPKPACRVVDSNTRIPELGPKLKTEASPAARQMSIRRGESLEPVGSEKAAHHELAAVIQGLIELGLNNKQLQDQFGCYGLAGMERFRQQQEGTPYARTHPNLGGEDIRAYIDGLTFYRPPAVGSAVAGAAEETQFTEVTSGSFVYVIGRGDQTSTHSRSNAGKQM